MAYKSSTDLIPNPITEQLEWANKHLAVHAPKETVLAGAQLSLRGSVSIRAYAPDMIIADLYDPPENFSISVVIKYGEDLSDIEGTSCTCPQFKQDKDIIYCRHVIATALTGRLLLPSEDKTEAEKIYTYLNRKDFPPLRNDPAAPNVRQSDYAASQLLKESAFHVSMPVETAHDDDAYILETIFEISDDASVCLSFRVGTVNASHMVVIRNLDIFVEGFHTGTPFALDMKTSVPLRRSAFAQDSLPIVDFLLERYDPQSNGYRGIARDMCDMVLNPRNVEAFFVAARHGRLKNRMLGQERNVAIKNDDCQIRILIEKADEIHRDGLILRFAEQCQLVDGVRRIFVVLDDVVYACGEEYSYACRGLLKALVSSKGSIYFSGKDVPALFANIVHKVGPFLAVEMTNNVVHFASPKLETRVYFDLDEAGNVTARMVFSYGDIIHDAFENQKRPDVSLDPAGEAYAESVLRHYLGSATSGPGTLSVLDKEINEEKIYILATEGLDKIREFAEVFVSENFEGLKARPPMKISVGVKVDGRLLTLNVGADGVDFSELAHVLKSYRLAKKYHRLNDGSFLALEGDALGELSDLAEGFGIDPGMIAGDVPVFLISLKAGGTGLNLTGADIVIHYDPWWNISVQNQATDRAHRIGQTSRVQVFKLIAKDSIEERIMEMQERKADLADRIIREGGDAFETLTEEELLALFE